MQRIGAFVALVSIVLLAVPLAAQEGGGNVAEVICEKIQPGKDKQYEEAVKKHMDWHGQQNDTWTWQAWQVITGEDTGMYCWGSFGHNWEDFDSPGVPLDAGKAHWQETGAEFVQSTETSFWTFLPKVSRPVEEQAAMYSVVFFHTRYGMDEKFNYLVGEFHKAIEKTNMPWKYGWYALANGGNEGTYALALPRSNFAAFNPTGKPFPEMLEEAYGKAGADALLAKWRKVVKSANNRIQQSRPDLGYMPASE